MIVSFLVAIHCGVLKNADIIRSILDKDIMCPHISYGTCGITLSSPTQKNSIVNNLRGLYAISGRDKHTCNWVVENTGRDCELVIDCALLNPYFVQNGGGSLKRDILIYVQEVDDNQV